MMAKHATDALLDRGFPACTHPDCGGSGFCATDRIRLRARILARTAYRMGQRAKKVTPPRKVKR